MNPILFQTLVEHTSDAVFIARVKDDSFIMEYVNDAYLRKFKLDRTAVIEQDLRQFLPDNLYTLVRERFLECMASNTTLISEEDIVVNNYRLACLNEIFPVHDTAGTITHLVCISKNIYELKKQRDLLMESEKTMFAIINSSDNILIYLGLDHRIKYLNRKAQQHAQRMFGRELQIGEKLSELYPAEELGSALQHVQQLIETRKTVAYEHSFTYPDGEQVWFLRRYYAVWDNTEQIAGVVIASIDITERKNHELQIQKHADVLREIAKIQSHEIRRPVANIMGLTELIDLKNKSEEENQTVLRYLRSSAEELDRLINQIVHKTGDNQP